MARAASFLPVLLLVVWPIMAAAGLASHGKLSIRVEGGRLTLTANEIPHHQLLVGLARQLNFELIIVGSLTQQRSLMIAGEPWEQGLKKALSPASWALVYEPAIAQARLVKVFLFAPEDTAQQRGRETGVSAQLPPSTAMPLEELDDAKGPPEVQPGWSDAAEEGRQDAYEVQRAPE